MMKHQRRASSEEYENLILEHWDNPEIRAIDGRYQTGSFNHYDEALCRMVIILVKRSDWLFSKLVDLMSNNSPVVTTNQGKQTDETK